MTALSIRVASVERLVGDKIVDALTFRPGVNVIVGAKDTGKTGWLRTLSFLLGDTGGPEGALGAGLATKFDSARLLLVVNGTDEIRLERRWKEPGCKHKILVNGEAIASSAFSEWIHAKLGIPVLHFPKGNPYSGAWPELSWRMLFRHIYREERFWSDIADKQPEREQHACLLQFLGAAALLYPAELGEEIQLRQDLLRLRARKEQFEDVLEHAARGLLADPSITTAPTRDSIEGAVARLRTEIANLRLRRNEILSSALSAKPGPVVKGAEVPLELGERRAQLLVQRDRSAESLTSTERRIEELSAYRSTVVDELTRIKRVEVAADLLRPLIVRRCPHCDQTIAPERAAPGSCFVCHQHLPWSAATSRPATKQRLAFEHEQLKGEDDELREVLEKLGRERDALKLQLRQQDGALSQIEVRLQPTRTALAAWVPPGLESLDIQVGQLEERIAQLMRLRDTLEQRDELAAQIDALVAKAETAGAHADAKGGAVPFQQLSDLITDGINEYLNCLNEGDSHRWEHEAVRCRINDRGFRILVGDAPWSTVGATSAGLVLLGYHYALQKLAGRDGFNYPGLALIDFPMTLADGTSIANKENYLIEPFVALAKENAAGQTIVCGRSFKGLRGAHRVQLGQVWAQGTVPALIFDALPPAGQRDLDLTIAAHFHSGRAQIMMFLDHDEVARLARLLPDLGADIAAGRTWPGKDVTIRWSGGTYVTRLVHHINNGSVAFTVPKRDAKRLWDYLDGLLQVTNPARDFAAHYSLGSLPALDEFFVDFRMPAAAP